MPAVHQDVWWRPVSDIPITEPRWVKMVEIRPANIEGRKILHHSIAYHILNPDNVGGREHRHRAAGPGGGRRRLGGRPRQPSSAADGVGHRQGLRPLHGGHRQADHAGREDLLGSAHPRRRRRDHERVGDRPVALSERPGADEAQLPDRLHRPEERHRGRSTSRRTRSPTPKASRCCGRTPSSPTSSRTSICAARRCRSRRSCRTAGRRSSATCPTSTSTG